MSSKILLVVFVTRFFGIFCVKSSDGDGCTKNKGNPIFICLSAEYDAPQNPLQRQGRAKTEDNHYLLHYIRLAINPPGIEYIVLKTK